MGRISFTPVVYKQFLRQDGTYIIKVRVTLNRQSRYLLTTEVAYPYQLTKNLAIKDPELCYRLNDLTRKWRQALAGASMEEMDAMSVDDAIARINAVLRSRDFHLDFMAFWVEAIQDKARGGRVNYTCALNAYKAFTGRQTLDISLVTARQMRSFEEWLVKKYGKGARAVTMYTAAVKHIHSLARKKYNSEDTGEILIRNPFEFYMPPKQKAPKHRDVELQVVQDMINERKGLAGRERRAVDAFLLSFALLGMNATDMYDCKPPRNGILIYNRNKTKERRNDGAEMRVKIDDRIMPLYREWEDKGKTHAFRYHLIHNGCRQLNSALAAGMKMYRERKHLTGNKLDFYSARHTWGTLAYAADVDKSIINDCLCHSDTSMKVTDIYISKDWSRLWRANARVLDLLDWSPLQG